MLHFDNIKTKNDRVIIGFNTGHHGGCALIAHGKIVSISEERLTRKKYADGYLNSFFYCLKALDLKVSDVELFVSSSYHQRLPDNFLGAFKELGIPRQKFITVDHHLSHAYSAYFLSPFDESLIVIIDGLGNGTDTESYYLAKKKKITKIGGNDPQRSIYKGIGRAYEVFTNYCGWSAQEAGITMGLAAYGKDIFSEIDLYKINNKFQIESLINGKYLQGSMDFVLRNNLPFGKPESMYENRDAAYFIQDKTEKIILELVQKLCIQHKIKNICLGGGVFLNSIINKKILDNTSVENLFVLPCCDDTGQALGNALYGFHSYFKNPKCIAIPHAYLGREYSTDEILDVIEKKQNIYPLSYRVKSSNLEVQKSENIAADTAKLLAKGNIIAWFQGGSEIGPRALGHRSILCSPSQVEMKDIINNRIKHREMFRPFAPSVLIEHASEYFDLITPSPFMLLVTKANETIKQKIPAVLHIDNTARVQTVNKNDNGLYYDLIKEFFLVTGVPVILNTSFNDNGEPIVETPRDALDMFCKTLIDYLVIGNYIISKK